MTDTLTQVTAEYVGGILNLISEVVSVQREPELVGLAKSKGMSSIVLEWSITTHGLIQTEESLKATVPEECWFCDWTEKQGKVTVHKACGLHPEFL